MSVEHLFDSTGWAGPLDQLYTELRFPDPPEGRPYTFLNMVSTVDGKILLGPRGGTAKGVGGPTDQILLRRLESHGDGAIIGAGTLRAGTVIYAPNMWRAVVTKTGGLPLDNRFFTDAPEKAIVFAPSSLPGEARSRIESRAHLRFAGSESVDVREAVRILSEEFGIRRLVLEGGADLNFDFFSAGLIDEWFVTLAPKVKGGEQMPTTVEGPGFADWSYAPLELISIYRDDSELYLRYRVRPEARIT